MALPPQQVISVLTHLANRSLDNAKDIHKVLSVIGQYGTLIHVSCMRSRTPPSIKLFVKVAATAVLPLLQHLDWPGDKRLLATLLSQPWLQPDSGNLISLDLKIDNHLTCYLGLVHSQITLTNGQDGIDRVTSLIEQDVLQSDAQINAVMSWLHPANCDGYYRWLDIKSAFDVSGTVTNKLYFGIQNRK